MAVDAEDILICLWRFLRFFVNISNNCAQKYPFVSCTLLLFFLVYVFFNILVYHFPFLICVAVLLRFFWTSERLIIQDVKEEKEKAKAKEKENQRKPLNVSRSVDDASKNCESPTLRRQKSRRTRVKPKETSNVEWNNFELVGKEEKELLFPLSIDKRSWLFENGETSSTHDNIFQADEQHTAATDCRISKLDKHLLPCDGIEAESRKSDGNGVVLALDNGEDIAEDEEEEEAHEGVNNKAVEWTEDDQKNLVDLGLSEIERNRRLESLIAKRRARKLIKNQLEKSLIDMESVPPSGSGTNQIPAPIFVARSNPFEAPNVVNEVDGLQVPGSAPSVLLPTQNPFDLPYDPLEEKPNLMGDSFTQEFTAVNQKEMMFCRHESFAFGPFQFDTEQDRRDNKFSSFFTSEKRAFDGLGYSRFRKQSDHDRLIEQLFGVGKSHIDHTPLIVQSGPQSAFQVSNSEMSNIEGGAETKGDMISEEEILNNMESANQMDSISTITEVDTEPSGVEDSETTSSSSFEVANRAEVSISLEPTHRYVEDDMFSCSIPIEPHYDSSPTANDKSGMDDDSSFFGEKRVIHTPSYSIASDLQVEVSEVSSPPLTIGNISPTDCDSLSYDDENFDGTSYDDLEEMETKLRGFSSSDALASENQEITMQLAEKLAAHPFFEVLSKTTESSSPLDESLEQNTNVRESVGDTIDNIANEKKHEEGDEGEQILTGQEIVESRAEPAEETESNAYSEGNSENLAEYLSMESAQQIKGNEDLDHKGDTETQSEQESVADEPKPRESEDDSITVDERKNEQSLEESEVPYINQKYEETCSSVEHQESMDEDEVLVNSSSPSSSMAAMIEQAPVDEVSSLNLDQIRQSIDLPKFDTEEELQRSSQEEQPPDGPILIMPQNITLQEPSASEMFTDKANTDIISNISEPMTEDKSGIEKSEINKDTQEVLETHFNPEVDEELSERPKKIGSGSNETIQNVLEELAEKSLSLSDESTEQNPAYGVRDSASDIIDEIADQEKHGDGGGQILIRQENVENMPEPAEEIELQFNARSTSDVDLNLKGDSKTQTKQQSTTDASNSIEVKDNLTTIEERKDEHSLVESEVSCLNQNYEEAELQELKIEDKVLVDSSSSLSPTAATIEQIPVDEVFSPNPPKFDMEDVMQSSSQKEQPPELTSCLSNISNSEILQVGDYETEPSASENFINDANTDAISNINEPVTEDQPGIEKSESTKDINKEKEEEESLFNPEVAEELSKPSAKTDSRSNENMEKHLAEELANSPSNDSEEGS